MNIDYEISEQDAANYKWHVSPNPVKSGFDVFCSNDDQQALKIAQLAIEQAWDDIEPGETRTVSITRAPDKGSET